MKTHYEPYKDEYEPHPFCRTPISDNTKTTDNWKFVNCEKCLNLKVEADKFVEQTESVIVRQMGEFVEVNK
jgi:hypothetical protein